jgi:hypothetical protein
MFESTITFRWWRDDKTPIAANEEYELIEAAAARILPMVLDGYVEGELCLETDSIDYSGYWKISTGTPT